MSEAIGKPVVQREPTQTDFDFVREVIVTLTALDRPKEEIREVLRENGIDVSLEDIATVQGNEAEAIRRQRAELRLRLRNLRERYVLSEKLGGIVRDIESIINQLKEQGKFREYTQLTPSLLKAIEMLNKAMQSADTDTLFTDEELAKIDFEFVKHLAELGYIEIKDRDGLWDYLQRGIDYEVLAMRAYEEWLEEAPEVKEGEL